MKHISSLTVWVVLWIIILFLSMFIVVIAPKYLPVKHKTSYQLKDTDTLMFISRGDTILFYPSDSGLTMKNNIYSDFKAEIDTFINGDTNDTLFIVIFPKDTFYIDAFADHIDTVIKFVPFLSDTAVHITKNKDTSFHFTKLPPVDLDTLNWFEIRNIYDDTGIVIGYDTIWHNNDTVWHYSTDSFLVEKAYPMSSGIICDTAVEYFWYKFLDSFRVADTLMKIKDTAMYITKDNDTFYFDNNPENWNEMIKEMKAGEIIKVK